MARPTCNSAAIQKLSGRELNKSSRTEEPGGGQAAVLPALLTDMISSGAEPGKI